MPSAHGNYLRDLGPLIREQAIEAKAAAETNQGPDREHHVGRLMAYYAVISLMIQQAEAFGIPASDLGLAGFDPEKDLLSD